MRHKLFHSHAHELSNSVANRGKRLSQHLSTSRRRVLGFTIANRINVARQYCCKMTQWIKISPSLLAGLKIIDQLDNGKFRALVNHLCSTLQLGNNGKIFSQEEEEKLLLSLEVNKETLVVLLDTIEFIFLQAAYGVVKPTAMETLMTESFPISTEKITIFVNNWSTHAKGIIESLRHKSIYPVQVDDIHWELSVQSSSSALSQEVHPVVWLQVGLSSPTEKSKLTVEMNKNDLTDIYNKFENIQRQLDQLEWVPEKNST